MGVEDLPVRRNVPLAAHNTFAVPCLAREVFELTSQTQIDAATSWLQQKKRPLILGAGSNVLLTCSDLPAAMLVRLSGIRITGESGGDVIVEVAAGENWHQLVQWSLAHHLWGLENLSLIPGSCGAAPVQNIGAYGVELADCLESLQAVNLHDASMHTLSRADCAFDYRDSLFKQQPGQWLITKICLRLSRLPKPQLNYGELARALASIDAPSARQISETVCAIRRRKLPDPVLLGNAGSFFKNPILASAQALALKDQYPDLATYPTDDPQKLKVAAGWLIEAAGLKGFSQGKAAVHREHALVLVNLGQASGADIWALATTVTERVEQKFGIRLEPEPLVMRA